MIFVTGGTGLLGTHVLFALSARSTPIRAIYRNASRIEHVRRLFRHYLPDTWEERFSRIEWMQGDILDVSDLEMAMEGCTEVYHCAALVSFHRRDFNRLLKINREGTFNMVNVALDKGVRKFCHVSSTSALGDSATDMIDEQTLWKNTPGTSGYSISKYSAEKEVWRAKEEGLNIVIVNPCVIIGPGYWNESSLTLFRTISKGLRHYPPGGNATVDARDVAYIMTELMDREIFGRRFLCIGSNQSFKILIGTIADALNVRKPGIEAKRYQVNIVRNLLSVWSLFTGKRNEITRETVRNLFSTRSYNARAIREILDFEFIPLKESVANAVKGRLD